ncbi:MAG TPA: D-glucuronyl C5-epimerase family protein [Thermoleophilaceae bacterium]
MTRPILLGLLIAGALLAAAPAAGASTVYEFSAGGRLTPRDDPAVPPAFFSDPPGPPSLRGAACAGVQPPVEEASSAVKRAVSVARSRHQITADEAAGYNRDYDAARRGRARIGGTNRAELSSVIGTLERIASRGQLSGGRMPALFLQLRRNTEFWTGDPKFPPRTDIPAEPCQPASTGGGRAGARISFPSSELILQYYPGQGLQIQPLGNFGKANGLYTQCSTHKSGCDVDALRKLLDELVAIRSGRGGFTTWEYWFYFSGGTPPWTSGMADATAIQALARGSKYLHVPAYMKVARSALGVFDKSAPVGVRVRGEGGGAHYLLYSFATGERVLNAFMQTLNGLYDYYALSHDKHALRLFREGDRSARRELPRYDTGAWTRYDLGGAEASLNYHALATDIVKHLCKRTKMTTYCRYAKRFSGYLTTPTSVHYVGQRKVGAGSRTSLAFTIDKVSCVTVKVTDGSGRRVYRGQARFSRGRHAFTWKPRSPGSYTLGLSVLDLKKNHTDLSLPIAVR